MAEPRVLATFEIPLPRELPTTNARKRWHWRTEARVVKGMREVAGMVGRSARIKAGVEPNTHLLDAVRREVQFFLVRGKGQRLLDPDSVPAALKPVLDGAVVDGAWAYDDSRRWLVYRAPEQERGPLPLVRVVIREAP